MGITTYSHTVRDDFEHVNELIERIEEQMPPALRGMLKPARDIVTATRERYEDAELGDPGR